MVLSEKRLKQRATNLCWMRSSLLASVDIIDFQTTDAYSILDLTNAMYNLSKHSKDEKLKGILWTVSKSLTHWEKIKFTWPWKRSLALINNPRSFLESVWVIIVCLFVLLAIRIKYIL
jgi:hypothetical protein